MATKYEEEDFSAGSADEGVMLNALPSEYYRQNKTKQGIVTTRESSDIYKLNPKGIETASSKHRIGRDAAEPFGQDETDKGPARTESKPA